MSETICQDWEEIPEDEVMIKEDVEVALCTISDVK